MIKKSVIIICNDKYIGKAIVSLKNFESKNSEYDMFILGTKFSKTSHMYAKTYNIKLLEINLENDFIDLDKRPYGHQYPLECFYRFYIPVALKNYDYTVVLEPDIYTNKKLNINYNNVKYIAGSYELGKKINNYTPIMNDIPKWNNEKVIFHLNQHRMLGGISIFNNKNLNNFNFYNKIVNIYQKSIKLNAPRCGDDSLMVLFQAMNPNLFLLYKNEFHTISETNIRKIPNITFFHSMGKFTKYWINIEPKYEINKYFNNKFIEYLYNNFSRRFIKKYFNDIYINIDNTKLNFYYYNKTNNFGDLLMPYILKKIDKSKSYNFDFEENNNTKILGIGSIMRLANKNTIVCGSGIRNINQDIKYTNALFVRGPHTRNLLLSKGVYTPPIYGDCGLLLPDFYKPKVEKKYELGIIPHYVDYEKVKNLYGNNPNMLVIDVKKKNIENTIKKILKCKKIISSSLHGLIISDAYNIPNKWIRFSNNINGDNIKFHDYFYSVNRFDKTPIMNINNYVYKLDVLLKLINDVNIRFKKNELKSILFYNDKGLTPYVKYLYQKLQNNT